MNLPIVRLRFTSRHNATAAADPLTADATLYTFLRSPPTELEVEEAMTAFRAHLHPPDSAANHAAAAGNTRTRVRLEAAVQGELLQYPPLVAPAWCAQHREEWLRSLVPPEAPQPPAQTEEHEQQQQQQQTPESTEAPAQLPAHEVVTAASHRAFPDPYAEYAEAHHLPPPPPAAERDSLYSGSTQRPEDGSGSDAGEGEAAGTPATDSGADGGTAAGGQESPPPLHPHQHPGLSLLARQAARRPPAPADEEQRRRHAGVEARLQAAAEALEAAARAAAEATAAADEEDKWSPTHARCRAAEDYLAGLAGRLGDARLLYRAVSEERRTLAAAHASLLMEVTALRAALAAADRRSVALLVASDRTAADTRLAREVQSILLPDVGAEGSADSVHEPSR